MRRFADRIDAGQALAASLTRFAGRDDVVVLGLPRGGVPVALEVARALSAPLDVLVVRKLGVPGHEEYAMGAIASGGIRVLSQVVIKGLRISEAAVAEVVAREEGELSRREAAFRNGRPALELAGRTVLLVDDGLATGSTMLAAVRAARAKGPARVVVAVPTGSAEACALLAKEADEVVCLDTPEPFRAVGLWYEDFSQTSDEQVKACLRETRSEVKKASDRG